MNNSSDMAFYLIQGLLVGGVVYGILTFVESRQKVYEFSTTIRSDAPFEIQVNGLPCSYDYRVDGDEVTFVSCNTNEMPNADGNVGTVHKADGTNDAGCCHFAIAPASMDKEGVNNSARVEKVFHNAGNGAKDYSCDETK